MSSPRRHFHLGHSGICFTAINSIRSPDVINDSCGLDASVHSPPLSWHWICPPTFFFYNEDVVVRHSRRLLKTVPRYICSAPLLLSRSGYRFFVTYNEMQVKKKCLLSECFIAKNKGCITVSADTETLQPHDHHAASNRDLVHWETPRDVVGQIRHG